MWDWQTYYGLLGMNQVGQAFAAQQMGQYPGSFIPIYGDRLQQWSASYNQAQALAQNNYRLQQNSFDEIWSLLTVSERARLYKIRDFRKAMRMSGADFRLL